jgi:hypothetical protein
VEEDSDDHFSFENSDEEQEKPTPKEEIMPVEDYDQIKGIGDKSALLYRRSSPNSINVSFSNPQELKGTTGKGQLLSACFTSILASAPVISIAVNTEIIKKKGVSHYVLPSTLLKVGNNSSQDLFKADAMIELQPDSEGLNEVVLVGAMLHHVNILPLNPFSEKKQLLLFIDHLFSSHENSLDWDGPKPGYVSIEYLKRNHSTLASHMHLETTFGVKLLHGFMLGQLFCLNPDSRLQSFLDRSQAYDSLRFSLTVETFEGSRDTSSVEVQFKPGEQNYSFGEDLMITFDRQSNKLAFVRLDVSGTKDGRATLLRTKYFWLGYIGHGYRSIYFEPGCVAHIAAIIYIKENEEF